MKTLDIDLNKLSDEGILRYMKLKQEMKEIKERETQSRENIEKQNQGWMNQQKPEMPPAPVHEPLPKMQVDDEQPMMFDDDGVEDED